MVNVKDSNKHPVGEAGTRPSAPAASRRAKGAGTREMLIRAGMEIFTERGFNAAGIEEILRRVDVPKGSFYHFFDSKQQFGMAVTASYAAYFERKLANSLEDESLQPLARIRAFADDAKRGMERFDFQRGCLVGNLGQELGGLNDAFRAQLEAVLQGWQRQTAACLREALELGQLPEEAEPTALAEFFWIGWEGAILRAKLTRSTQPLDRFLDLFFLAAAAAPQR